MRVTLGTDGWNPNTANNNGVGSAGLLYVGTITLLSGPLHKIGGIARNVIAEENSKCLLPIANTTNTKISQTPARQVSWE